MFPVGILVELGGGSIVFAQAVQGVEKGVEVKQVTPQGPQPVDGPFHVLQGQDQPVP